MYDNFSQPAYRMFGQPQRRPRYSMYGQTPGVPAAPTTPPSYMQPGLTGQQPALSAPPQYNQPGAINDPTLAVGGGGGGGGQGQVSGRQVPPGAIEPPMQSTGVPPWLYSKGWRARRGPDGHTYWMPPGSEQPNAPSYSLY